MQTNPQKTVQDLFISARLSWLTGTHRPAEGLSPQLPEPGLEDQYWGLGGAHRQWPGRREWLSSGEGC